MDWHEVDWHEEAAGGLPAPRDDEPAALRNDILDELADHLRCALRRELAKNVAPNEAIENVKRRFGDPRAVARRLWLDALKEKIMSQRLTLATMVVLACASIAATGLAWVAVRESRAANAAILDKMTALAAPGRESSLTLARVADSNTKVLNQLAAMSAANAQANQTATPSDWCRVKFHFVRGTKGGPPIDRVQVRLDPYDGRSTDPQHGEIPVEKTSDAAGEADCGFVHYGNYALDVRSPWNDTFWESNVQIRPGIVTDRTIVCPAGPLEHSEVRFRVNWPDDLAKEKLWLALRVASAGRTIDGITWTPRGGTNDPLLVVDPNGDVLSSAGQFWFPVSATSADRPRPERGHPSKLYVGKMEFNPCSFADRRFADQRFADKNRCLGWSNQRFVLGEIAVVRAEAEGTEQEELMPKKTITWQKHLVLSYVCLPNGPTYVERNAGQRNLRTSKTQGLLDHNNWSSEYTPIFRRLAAMEPFQTFEPIAGKENVWNIPLPDSLLKQVRAALKNETRPKAQDRVVPKLAPHDPKA